MNEQFKLHCSKAWAKRRTFHERKLRASVGSDLFFIYLFFCHIIITKNIGKEEKKKWRGDLTETIGAYERLGLLEL